MVYKNTDTQILTLFYMVYVNSLKCIKNKSFYVMKMKFIDVCLIVIKNEEKKGFFKYLRVYIKTGFLVLNH